MFSDFCGTSGPSIAATLYTGVHAVRLRGATEQIRNLTVTITISNSHVEPRMKIVLSDGADPSFLCVLIIAPKDYEEIKKTMGLLVDFNDFPAQFVRLLQQCDSGNMFLSLSQEGPSNIYLEVVQRNDFIRLVHLSLKTGVASDVDIKKNMADNILLLQKNLANVTSTLKSKEDMFVEKEKFLEMRVNDLNNLLSQLNEEKLHRENEFQEMLKKERERLEQEKQEWKKCAELYSKNQNNSMQDSLSRKEKQLDDLTSRCRQLHDTVTSLESQVMDKSQRMVTLEKNLHAAKSDAETWRNQNEILDREYKSKDKNLQQTKTRLLDVEKVLKDKSEMLRDALDSLQSLKRERTTLEEKANHHENLSTKRNMELQNINEEILKANQIITKQNNDILESREKLMCRTAIIVEQEKVIERISNDICQYKEKETTLFVEIENDKKTIEKLRTDLESYKQVVEEKGEIIKNNNAVIQWLQKKLDAIQSVNELTSSASCRLTPSTHSSIPFTYPQSANENNLSSQESHRLSNLYSAGLKGNASAKTDHNVRNQQPFDEEFSLDPVYLQPSGHPSTKTSNRSKSQDSLTKEASGAIKESKKFGVKTSKISSESKKSGNENRFVTSAISAYFPKP